MTITSWEDILDLNENEIYSDSDFKREIAKLEDNNKIEQVAPNKSFDLKARLLNFPRLFSQMKLENLIADTKVIEENLNHKFPQANNIKGAFYTLYLLINEEKFVGNAPNAKDLAEIYGFTERQGFYYGDFLEFLGFLEKKHGVYEPTAALKSFKRAENEKRLELILTSIFKHQFLKDYYRIYKSEYDKKNKNEDLLRLLSANPLMIGFSKSTIARRKSSIDALMKWIDSVVYVSPRPFIKWAGGKQKILNELIKRTPDPQSYTKYIEPFAGGAALFYNINFEEAIINDFNGELINSYIQVKDNLNELKNLLKTFENNESTFYNIRNLDREENFSSLYSNIFRAARFIYLNKTCFNGLYRVNSKGYFNTPFGFYKNSSYLDFDTLTSVNNFLNNQRVTFANEDFENVIKEADSDTFLYLDPPYDPLTQTASFTAYTHEGFDRKDQIRLKKRCDELTKKGVKIMISNHDTPFIRELFNDPSYRYETIDVQRNISSKSSSRKKVKEVIITNYNLF